MSHWKDFDFCPEMGSHRRALKRGGVCSDLSVAKA